MPLHHAALNVDPLLGTLSASGGLGETLPLRGGSPALDAAGNACPKTPVDERGVTRPRGAGCDLGAFESAADASVSVAPTPDPVAVGGVLSSPSPPRTREPIH